MYINDDVFDNGLVYAQSNGTKIDICSAEPAGNLFANIAAVTLGNKSGLTTSPPENNTSSDGRKVVVPAILDGTVTGTDTATHWVLSNGTSILLASGTLTLPQDVTASNTFTLDAINIAIRDAVAA